MNLTEIDQNDIDFLDSLRVINAKKDNLDTIWFMYAELLIQLKAK